MAKMTKRKRALYIRLPLLKLPELLKTDPLKAAKCAATTVARTVDDLLILSAAESPPSDIASNEFLSKWKQLDRALDFLRRAFAHDEVKPSFASPQATPPEFAGYPSASYFAITHQIGLRAIRTLWRFISPRKWAFVGDRSLRGTVPKSLKRILHNWPDFRATFTKALEGYHSARLVFLIEKEFQTAKESSQKYRSPILQTNENRRACAGRDELFQKWYDEGMGQAKIRDRWNAMTEDARKKIAPRAFQQVSPGNAGRDLVRKAIMRFRKQRGSQHRT